jgi:hypothetical protein
MEKDTFLFTSPSQGPEYFIDQFERFYGPTMNAFDAANKNGKADQLRAQLRDLAISQNTAKSGGTSIPATFMRVTVQR